MNLSSKKIKTMFGIGLLCLSSLIPTNVFAQKKIPPKKLTTVVKNTQNIDELRKRGFAFLQVGNWESAKNIFAEVLLIQPKDTLSIYGKALALFNLKEYLESEASIKTGSTILEKNLENNQLLADFLVLSAVISAVQNANSAAIQKLEKAIGLAPNHFDANFSLGRAYFGNGEIDKAVASFQKAAEMQPQNARAKFFLATALERIGNVAEALNEYRNVLKISPNSADGNLGLGVLLIKSEGDRSAEGLQALQKAVELNADLYEAQITLGKTLVRLNRAEEALGNLEKAAQLAPNNPEPFFQLALAYRKLGRKAEAEEANQIVKRIHENRRGASIPQKD